jgi:hypothetical protein
VGEQALWQVRAGKPGMPCVFQRLHQTADTHDSNTVVPHSGPEPRTLNLSWKEHGKNQRYNKYRRRKPRGLTNLRCLHDQRMDGSR